MAQDLRNEYDDYDRRVDIVSAAEVWFTKSRDLAPTVRHFERFPKFHHPDGGDATPDFTVLFKDGTGLVGEISSLALRVESLDRLAAQIGRYDELPHLPAKPNLGSGHMLADVAAIDVVLFVPHPVANKCIDRLDAAIGDQKHPYAPSARPMVLGWSFDSDRRYTFTRDDRGGSNPLVRSHERHPTLAHWLRGNSDTLRGIPDQFGPVKVTRRFMNDDPPELYTATVLWSEMLPAMLERDEGGRLRTELTASPAEIAEAMRARYGFGRADHADKVLRFLRRAGLATQHGDMWKVRYQELSRSGDDIHEALIARATSKRRKRAETETRSGSQTSSDEPETLLGGEGRVGEDG